MLKLGSICSTGVDSVTIDKIAMCDNFYVIATRQLSCDKFYVMINTYLAKQISQMD